jgi:hypothetical protein
MVGGLIDMAKRLNDGQKTWRELDLSHKELRMRKAERIGMLTELVRYWETRDDHEYLLALKRRLRSAENQLAAMKL